MRDHEEPLILDRRSLANAGDLTEGRVSQCETDHRSLFETSLSSLASHTLSVAFRSPLRSLWQSEIGQSEAVSL